MWLTIWIVSDTNSKASYTIFYLSLRISVPFPIKIGNGHQKRSFLLFFVFGGVSIRIETEPKGTELISFDE